MFKSGNWLLIIVGCLAFLASCPAYMLAFGLMLGERVGEDGGIEAPGLGWGMLLFLAAGLLLGGGIWLIRRSFEK